MNHNNIINAANESRFTAAHYSEALTEFSAGWKDQTDIEGILDFVAPPIPVGRRFEFKRGDNAEAFFYDVDDVRAIGSEFKRVEYKGSSVNEKTLNKGLTIRVDHDEISGDDWQERYTQILLQRLLRSELVRLQALMGTSTSVNTKVTWGDGANPDADLRKLIKNAADKTGIRPNRVLFGEGIWNERMTCLESQSNAVAFRAGAMTPEELSAKLMLEGCKVVSARYQTDVANKAGAMSSVAYAFYASDAVTKDEPSNFKRFYTPMDDGNMYRVYCEEHAKYTDISVEHYSSIINTGSSISRLYI